MLGSVTLDLDPVDRGRSTVGGLGPKWYYVGLRIILCGSGYFLESWVKRVPPARAGIDYGMPEFVRRPRFRFRTLSVEPIMVSWQRQCILICSDFPATPEPFRKFIFCIKVLKALTLLG
ncbi:hypothetical protein M9H77_09470 [Catharanthus roseus]|uniref:Uncharacterized protein n=1 Tax=Catharanthus roseus TaxID=4058 RepID=A0ACC0C0V1_CATRO|nr:hypothetical protein M9H77_09470 [Catharanthus roseus]